MKEVYKVIVLILPILLVAKLVFAQNNTTQYCLDDNTTLIKISSVNFDINGNEKNIMTNESVICQYGCADNNCNYNPFYDILLVIGIMIGLILFGLIIYKVF